MVAHGQILCVFNHADAVRIVKKLKKSFHTLNQAVHVAFTIITKISLRWRIKIMKVRAYTDGACSGNPGPGGWAAVILFPSDRQEISGYEEDTTNNRMELRAAVETLRLVLSLGYTKIDIYSDSAYVVNAVKKEWLKKWGHNGWKTVGGKDVKNKDLWLRLVELLTRSQYINFIKVKGHSGDKNNELVDKLAKREVERAKEEAIW